MIPPRNATIVIVITIALIGLVILGKIMPRKQTSNPQATTTPAVATSTEAVATSTEAVQNFSPQKTAAAKVEDKTKTFVNQSGPSVLAVPPPRTEFSFIFNAKEVFEESDSLEGSASPYWWLDSGAFLISTGAYGETLQGQLSHENAWYTEYLNTNPIDTDGGIHPQNIFRLVTKSVWNNVRQEMFFKVTADNFSASPNRNESNGILLMNRYQDHGDTLYYTGLRVDGTAVIKKKYKGAYYTMAQESVLPGVYSLANNSNLLPHQKWIGLRSETTTGIDGSVTIKLYLGDAAGTWVKVLTARDNGKQFDGTPTIPEGRIGIRTDFMDVQFRDFHAEQI